MSKDELDGLDPVIISKLDENDFHEYKKQSRLVGNSYMYKGVVDFEIKGPEKYYYGKTTKSLIETAPGDWKIFQGGGLLPSFAMNPILMDEIKFRKMMELDGVSKDLIDEFIVFEPDYENF